LSKSPKDVLGAECANLKISNAAECYRTCMAERFPKPLRTLYRCDWTRTSNSFTSDEAAVGIVEGYGHETGDLRHVRLLSGNATARSARWPIFKQPIASAA
jgi:hypothetical protein